MSENEKKDGVEVKRNPVEAPEAPVRAEASKAPEDTAKAAEAAPEPAEAAPEAAEGKPADGLATPEDPEDAKRLGIKETTENADAMSIAKKKSEEAPAEDEPVAPPSFFIEEGKRHRVEVDILCSKKDGAILSVSRTGLGIDYKDFTYLNHVKEWFEFTVPTYEDLSSYRQRCGIYRQEAQQVLIDRLQLRNFLLVWHLKEWSLRKPDGTVVELGHEPNKSLDDASMKAAYSVHPTIMDVVLTIFEKDILLT